MSQGDESLSSVTPREDLDAHSPRVRRSGRWVPAVVVSGVIVLVLAGLLIPAVGAAREAARRASCACHLKQMGLMLQTYHDTYHSLPPAYFVDDAGKPAHSWRVIALEFANSDGVYKEYDFDNPWDAGSNAALLPRTPKFYHCPSDFSGKPEETSYVAVVGTDTAWPFDRCRKLDDMALDGTSNTALIVEVVDRHILWSEPRDLEFATIDFHVMSPQGMDSRHSSGAMVMMADGSAKMLMKNSPPNMVERLFTIADGLPIMLP